MELTDSLRKEFINSLKRLVDSINYVLDTNDYVSRKLMDIHRTYIEYCMAFKKIDIFSDVSIDTDIKCPFSLETGDTFAEEDGFLRPFVGKSKIRRRDYFLEQEAKKMLREIIYNLTIMKNHLYQTAIT